MALLAIVGNGNGDYVPERPARDAAGNYLLPWQGLEAELAKYGSVRALQPKSGTPFRAVFRPVGADGMDLCQHEHRHPAQAAACARQRRRNPAIRATSGAPITERDYPGLFQDTDRDRIPDADDPDPFVPGDESVEEVRLADEVRELIRTRQDFDHMRVQLVDRLRAVAPGAEIKSRTKTPYSILNKLRRKRLLGPKGITDLVGAMVVAHDASELDRLVQLVQSGALGPVMEHEDLYAQPRDGYRAHHFVLLVDGKPAELQIKTKRMKAIAGAAHHAYKTGALDGGAMLELTTLADRADRGDPEAARYVDFYLSDPAQLEGLLTRRKNGARHNPPSRYSDGMSLIGLDADSWARVAEWLRHSLSPGPLFDPHGVEVRLPDGPVGDRILMAWSNDAAAAGCPDWVVADLEPLYRGGVSPDLLEQGRRHREEFGLNPPGTTVANLYTGEHRFYPLSPAEAVQAASAHDGTPFRATSVAGHVRAGAWVARDAGSVASNPRVDSFWYQLLDTVHYALHGDVSTKPSRGVATITAREWIALFPGLRSETGPGRRPGSTSGKASHAAAEKAWNRFLQRVREEDEHGAGIRLPSDPGVFRASVANAYDAAWRAMPGQPHPYGEQWEQLLLERDDRAVKSMPPGLERARARRAAQERRVAQHGLYQELAEPSEHDPMEHEIPGGSMDAYEEIRRAVRAAREVSAPRAELEERENKSRRPKEPRAKPPKSKKISLEEAEKIEGYSEALKAYRKFHGTDPTEVEVFYLPDGKKGERMEPVHAALHHTIETNYVVPWESNKKDTLWIHEHPEGGEPLEVYDPRTKTTRKILRGSIVKDWWFS